MPIWPLKGYATRDYPVGQCIGLKYVSGFFRTVGFRFAGVDQADYPFHVTKFVRHSGGHRGRDLERLMSLHEVVIDEVQTEHMQVVFQFFTECVGQPGESPNTHPHG